MMHCTILCNKLIIYKLKSCILPRQVIDYPYDCNGTLAGIVILHIAYHEYMYVCTILHPSPQ